MALFTGGSSCSAVHTSYTRSSALCTDPLLLGSLGLAYCNPFMVERMLNSGELSLCISFSPYISGSWYS